MKDTQLGVKSSTLAQDRVINRILCLAVCLVISAENFSPKGQQQQK